MEAGDGKMRAGRKHFYITIAVTMAALVFLSTYMMVTFYQNARKDALALGVSTMGQESRRNAISAGRWILFRSLPWRLNTYCGRKRIRM